MKNWIYLRWLLVSLGSLTVIGLFFDQKLIRDSEFQREPAGNPLTQNIDFFAGTIYKTGVSLGKLPVKLALPIIVKYKINDYIDGLPVKAEVKERIHQRLKRADFVDAVIPFAWALKEQYMIDKDFSAKNSFDAHVKKTYSLSEKIPGLRHSLYDWGIKDPNGGGKTDIPELSLDKQSIARMIELYDVLFLKNSQDYIFTSKKIRQETINEAVPMLKSLLKSFADKMEAGSDTRKGIENLTNDQLEAVVISAATFLRNLVQKNYQAFASLILRQQDLKKWLFAEYDKKDFGDLYRYLLFMNQTRRFGVQIVVDGLQGKLVESLSEGTPGQRYFQQLVDDEKNQKSEIEKLKGNFTPIVSTSNRFLTAIAANANWTSDKRYLPFFKGIFNTSRGFIASQGISTTPTISVRNLPIVKTGADVAGNGGTGIPNFHFVDRAERSEGRAYYFYGNDALLLEDLAKARGLKTMPTRLSRFNTLNCNAQYDEGTRKSFDSLLNLIIGEKARDFGELLCLAELDKRAKNEVALREKRATVADNIKGGRDAKWLITQGPTSKMLAEIAELTEESMPEYLMMYIPWPDHFAHFKGPFSDEIISPTGELSRLDYWLSRFSEAYSTAGITKNTLWTMAGDHGLTPVYYYLNPEHEVFGEMKKEGMDLVVEKISSDEGGPPKITHPYRPPSMKDKDVIVASTAGGNYMIDLFNSQKYSEWKIQPTLSELKKWRTLAGREVDIVEEVRKRLGETLDYMVLRNDHKTATTSSVAIVSTRHGQPVIEYVTRVKDRYYYRGSDFDLLQLKSDPKYRVLSADNHVRKRNLLMRCMEGAVYNDVSSWCDRHDWLELTALTDRPDSVVQLAHLYDEDRAGTINLFPRAGFGYNTIVPGRHAGETFHEKDAFVGMWGDGIQKRVRNFSLHRRLPLVNGSLAPTVYEYMTNKVPEVGRDGWGFPSIFDVIRNDGEATR